MHAMTVSANELIEEFLVPALFEHQHERILAEVFAELCQMHLTTDLATCDQPHSIGNRAMFDRGLRQPNLFVDLQRARLNADRLRKARDRIVLFYDHKIDPIPDELASEGKSGRTATNDDDVCIHCVHESISIKCHIQKYATMEISSCW